MLQAAELQQSSFFQLKHNIILTKILAVDPSTGPCDAPSFIFNTCPHDLQVPFTSPVMFNGLFAAVVEKDVFADEIVSNGVGKAIVTLLFDEFPTAAPLTAKISIFIGISKL